jgi:hypothetical protein
MAAVISWRPHAAGDADLLRQLVAIDSSSAVSPPIANCLGASATEYVSAR